MVKKINKTGRSKGEPQHVRLYHWLLKSEAWGSLDVASRALLIELMFNYNGRNNGDILLGIRDAAVALHIGKNKVARAFLKLQTAGFIEPIVKGSFDWKISIEQGKPTGRATRWRLNEFECHVTGVRASKAFMDWRSTVQKVQNAVPPQAPSVPTAGPMVPPQVHSPKKTVNVYPRRDHKGQNCAESVPTVGHIIVYQSPAATMGAGAALQEASDPQPRHDVSENEDLKPLRDIIDLSKMLRQPTLGKSGYSNDGR
jgi:hypothetical protein